MNQVPKITRLILATLLVATPYTASAQPKTVQQAHPANITTSASQQQSLPFFSRWYQQASSWTAKALIIGAIGFGIYYLANKQLAKKKTTPPLTPGNNNSSSFTTPSDQQQPTQKNSSSEQKKNQKNPPKSIPTKQLKPNKNTQAELNLTGKPANFSHSGPICYRNSLFQVLCHADGIAPAIFAELKKSPRKAKSTQEFYNLMTSKEKIKDWEKNYPHLHQMLFTAVGETGNNHAAQDASKLLCKLGFGYGFGQEDWGIASEMPIAQELITTLLWPFEYNKKNIQEQISTNIPPNNQQKISFKITTLPQCLYVRLKPENKCSIQKTTNLSAICASEATTQRQTLYDLVGVVCYIPGHYIAYIRRNDIWYRCDDVGQIEQINTPFTQDKWVGKTSELPYMLFYAKQ